MRAIFLPFLLCITLFSTALPAQSLDTYSEASYVLISDEEIKARLANIQNNVVEPQFTPAVRSYINTYTVKKRDNVEAMLGRTVIYYPLFERLLEEYGLPSDLKYLSVVESALNAHAVSRSGAVGLWQFMPPTGKEYGLRINSQLDERKDPEKATRAALTYLARLHKKYGNWELALAAYNGGPGRVNRAVKRGRSKNFWRIRRYLPRETRAYIPAYIAATYINHYYQEHNLVPVYPDTDFQLTETIKLYEKMSFEEIEQATGAPMYVIEFLNPSYKRGVIPANTRGSNLVLPHSEMAIFKNTFHRPDSERQMYTVSERIIIPQRRSDVPADAIRLNYQVEDGDAMEALAQSFRCISEDIMKWNRLTSSQLRPGQSLVIYVDKAIMQPVSLLQPLPLRATLPEVKVEEVVVDLTPVALPENTSGKSSKKRRASKVRYLKHKIKRGETLHSIAAQYEGVSVNDLFELNQIETAEAVRPGKKLKIRKK